MKNKDKYDLHKISWEVSRLKNNGYFIKYITKIYLNENGRAKLIDSIDGGSKGEFLDWLEKETKDDKD